MQSLDNIDLVANPGEIETFENFRNMRIEQKRRENQPKIDALWAEIEELRNKFNSKKLEFKCGNRKPNLANQALMRDVYNYSNRIIEKVCKINELENIVTIDSEKDSLIM
jgi:capsule polysaccharide export protein KpsE/RkpR